MPRENPPQRAGKRPVLHSMMACFNPRHAFVFYDAAMKAGSVG
jgi:hypothetical protein